jgi:hypothetical protein
MSNKYIITELVIVYLNGKSKRIEIEVNELYRDINQNLLLDKSIIIYKDIEFVKPEYENEYSRFLNFIDLSNVEYIYQNQYFYKK